MSSEPATLIVAGDDEGRGLQQLKPKASRLTQRRAAGRGLGAQRRWPHRRSPPSAPRGVWHTRAARCLRGPCAWQGVAPSGGSAGGPRVREPGQPRLASRTSVCAADCPRPRGRQEQGPGHGSARPTAQRAPSRPGASVPKDVRTPSRRQAARICHSTERSIVGITTSGGSSMLPTRAGCQHHQPERVSGRARAHMCVCSARLGPRTCARAHVGGIITQPLSAST